MLICHLTEKKKEKIATRIVSCKIESRARKGGGKGGAFQFPLVEEKDIKLAANIKHHPLRKAIQKDFFFPLRIPRLINLKA